MSALGVTLPPAPAPAAAYVPAVRSGNLVFVAGQLAMGEQGLLATGKVGGSVDLATAAACARQCALNILAQLRAALGTLDQVVRVVKLVVYVASVESFTQQHVVANSASELFTQVFGDAGRHARAAVGVCALPFDSPVEVEAIVEAAG